MMMMKKKGKAVIEEEKMTETRLIA